MFTFLTSLLLLLKLIPGMRSKGVIGTQRPSILILILRTFISGLLPAVSGKTNYWKCLLKDFSIW